MIDHNAKIRVITIEDIQLLRFWRNLDYVRSNMVNNDLIKYDSQLQWFKSIHPKEQRHFIYSLSERDIGSVNISKIDHKFGTFEVGILCGDQAFLSHWINIWACIKIYDFAFKDLGLNSASARILRSNEPAISLNQSLGYQLECRLESQIDCYTLSSATYFEASKKIKWYLRNFAKQKI